MLHSFSVCVGHGKATSLKKRGGGNSRGWHRCTGVLLDAPARNSLAE
jgi:hypothetical protein